MTVIPYTVERRPDTGVNNVQLGVWLFLASEVMLFGGLFSAYFTLRAGSVEAWPPLRDHATTAVFSTLNLVLASMSFGLALIRAREYPADHKAVNRARLQLGAALVWALGFCLAKTSDYERLFSAGIRPATSTHMATYFLLTGVHVLHVAGGMLATLWLALTRRRTWDASPAIVVNRMQAVALYWYFIDVVWLVIFALLYVF